MNIKGEQKGATMADDNMPDVPLENFGADTEVATPPVAEAEAPAEAEQTAQETETSGSEDNQEAQPEKPEDNPIVEEGKSGRPEKQDRLQNRFGELTGKIRERDAELEKANAMIAQLTATGSVTPLQPDESGNYSVEEIQRFNAEQARAIASSEVTQLKTQLERESIANRIDSEGSTLEIKYAEDFKANPEHQAFIRSQIQRAIDWNKNNLEGLKQISPIQIADEYMRNIASERRRAQSSTASNLQTLQAESAVNPEGAPASVDPNSEEALEARVSNLKF